MKIPIVHAGQHQHPEIANFIAGKMQEAVFLFYLLHGILV
jgi:hypothetical protein